MSNPIIQSIMTQAHIHPLADVQSTAIGERSRLWQFVVVLPGARIGSDCTVGSHCLIGNDVVLGDHVTVGSGVALPDGMRVGNDVSIGPNATFAAGLAIGANALVGAGAVVTRAVPPNAIVEGNPARVVGYTNAARVAAPAPGTAGGNTRASHMAAVTLHQMPVLADPRGSLSVGEFERSIPFATKRYFAVFGVPDQETRGEHAHRECHQFLVCVHGSCTVLADDGTSREEFVLDRPDLGLHLPPLTWGVQYKYSSDAVLMVFASHYYDNADYIRDYSEFRQLVGAAA